MSPSAFICKARPHADDKRACELSGDHETHLISGVATDKFGEHAYRLTWRDSSYGAIPR